MTAGNKGADFLASSTITQTTRRQLHPVGSGASVSAIIKAKAALQLVRHEHDKHGLAGFKVKLIQYGLYTQPIYLLSCLDMLLSVLCTKHIIQLVESATHGNARQKRESCLGLVATDVTVA